MITPRFSPHLAVRALLVLGLLSLGTIGTTGCGQSGITTTATIDQSGVLSGVAVPFQGVIAQQNFKFSSPFAQDVFQFFTPPDAYGAACGPVYASLFAIDGTGGISSTALATSLLKTNDGAYSFGEVRSSLGVDIREDPNVRYVVQVAGCNFLYTRPVTEFWAQTVTAGTSLVSFALNTTQMSHTLRQINRGALNDFMAKLSDTTIYNAYTAVSNSPTLGAAFTDLFGADVTVLEDAAPNIVEINAPTGTDEGVGALYQVSASHWSPVYPKAYQWKKDDVNVSTNANWTYTPGANDQGLHTIDLLVGKDNGHGVPDLTKSYVYKTYSLLVHDTVMATPLNLTLGTPASAPVNTRQLVLNLETGVGLGNCASFTGLALTENTLTAPTSPSAYTLLCATAPVQSVPYNLATIGDGVKTLRLWAMDASGNIGPVPSSLSILFDSTAPTVSITTPTGPLKGGNTVSLNFAALDAGAGLTSGSVTIQYASNGTTFVDVATVAGSAISYSWTIPSDSVATAKLKLIAVDAAGNSNSATTSAFTIDSTAPTVSITTPTGPFKGGNTVSLSFAASDAGAGMTLGSLTIQYASNGTTFVDVATVATSATTYTWTIPSDSVATAKLKLVAVDAAGNSNSATTSAFTIDSTAPTASITTPGSLKGGSTYSIAFSASAGGSGLASLTIKYASDGSTFSTTVATPATNATSYSWTVPSDNVATAKLEIIAVNNVGVSTTTVTSAFVVDSTVPTASITTPGSLQGGSTYSIAFSASDGGTGLASLTIKYASDGSTFSTTVATPATSATSYSWTVPSDNVATAKLEIIAVDNVGNSTTTLTSAFMIDSTAPTASITTPGSLKGGSTYSIAFSASAGGSGLASLTIKYASDGSTFSTTVATPATSATSYSWTVPSDNVATAKLEIIAVNNVGVSTTTVTTAFTIDSTVPTASITTPGSLKGGSTYSIAFSASDGGSGLSSLTIKYASDGSTFSTTVATPATSATSYSWTVPSDNVATAKLEIIAVDNVGNSTTTVTSAFVVDSTGPTASITTPGSLKGGSTYFIAFSAGDAGSGLASLTIKYASDGSTFSTTVATPAITDTSYSWTVPSDNVATAKLEIIVVDSVGNSTTSSATSAFIIDSTAPTVSITTPTGPLKGGNTVGLSFAASDAGAGMTSGSLTIQYASDGTTFVDVTTVATSATTYTWTIPGDAVATAKLKLVAVDAVGNSNSATTSAFMIDSTAPVLTAGQMSINGGAASTTSNYVQVSLRATDSLTNITQFCLKTNSTTQPTSSDACWVLVNAPTPGLTAALSLNLTNFSYLLGFVTGNYTFYAWVQDQLGNISSLTSAGAGTAGVDKATITYSPGQPPSVINVSATSTDVPASPFASTDLYVTAGSTVYIRWDVATAANGLGANPVTLAYTTNDSTFTEIASNVANAANGCTVDGSHTGCYVWTNGSPTSSYYKVRVSVLDSSGMATVATSNPLNVFPPLNILAGNTDPGTNGSASAAMFFNVETIQSADPQSFVVTPSGVVYFRDKNRGILVVDPSNGIQKILVAMDSTQASNNGDGGPVSSATVKQPNKIALDYQNRLLVFDYDRIRLIDLNASPITINTFIGGGGSTLDGVAPTNVLITSPGVMGAINTTAAMPFFPLPNGDLYFQSENYHALISAGARVRVYHAPSTPAKAQDNTVTSITPSGTGIYGNPAFALAGCLLEHFGFTFDPLTSNILSVQMICYDANSDPNVSLNPSTFVSTAPHPPTVFTYGRVTYKTLSRTGDIWITSDFSGNIAKYIPSTNTWTTVVGTGTVGVCEDGTAALSCNIDPKDTFVTATGQVYFMDRGRLRTLDSSNQVVTIIGQLRSFGDGGNPLSARFNSIYSLDKTTADDIIVYDSGENRLRQLTIGGTIQTIAGNGNPQTQNTTAAATTQGIYAASTAAGLIRVNPSTGDVFSTINGYIMKLDRSTSKWVALVGGGATSYSLADSLTGTNISMGSYTGGILGFDGTNLLMVQGRYSAGVFDCFLKNYTITNGTQSHVAGFVGSSCGGLNADTTPVTSSGTHANTSGTLNMIPAYWDGPNNRWLSVDRAVAQTTVRALNIGGNLGPLTTTTYGIGAFTYRKEGSNEYLYYCKNSTSGTLQRKNITAGTESSLAWPISSLFCSGYSLLYDSTRNSLIFPFTQNGLGGVAEYILPGPIAISNGTQNTASGVNTVTFNGTCGANVSTISVTGTSTGTTACTNGSWSYATPTQTGANVYNYTFTGVDGAGNLGDTVVAGAWTHN
ncbi:hypothetical protein WDW37_05210 [Bdellovibrionota bacterium FG-1]